MRVFLRPGRIAFLVVIVTALSLGYVPPRPALAAVSPATTGASYYVDSVAGSDLNTGTSTLKPWKTLAAVRSHRFSAGDTIYLKAGSRWNDGLEIVDSGLQGKPITFTSYGSGALPIITYPGPANAWQRAVVVTGQWVVIEKIKVMDTPEAGIELSAGANNNVVRNVEVTQTGVGIGIYGQYNLITANYVHDLHMAKNTAEILDDDYGASGIGIYGPNNEVSYNRIINCIAPSYDYGVDGGVIEMYGNVEGAYVHHNWSSGSDGFLEVGAGTAKNVRLSYNVSINNNTFFWVHMSGQFASMIDNLRVENNTIVETKAANSYWHLMGFGLTPSAGMFSFRNNLVYVNEMAAVANTDSFVHTNNLYFSPGNKTPLGFVLGATEKWADPRFTNLATVDLHPLATSLAIDLGAALGYAADMDNIKVPSGNGPDAGAYENGASVTVPVVGGRKKQIVPVAISSSGVSGMTAADLWITFDGNVLRPIGAVTGDLSQGWAVEMDANIAGQVRVSLVGALPLPADSGVLAVLEFEVMGDEGSTTSLHLDSSLLDYGVLMARNNDGFMTVEAAQAEFYVLYLPLAGSTRP